MSGSEQTSGRYGIDDYFALVEDGSLAADDRVELLRGIVVSMSPQQPRHAATVWWISGLLTRLLGERVIVRSQLPLLVGSDSVPEPDIAVVPFRADRYVSSHPSAALLVIEVSDSSLVQDRLTKAAIYSAAAIPDYWVVNLRKRQVEWFREPDANERIYRETGIANESDPIPHAELRLSASDVFPPS